MTPKPGRGWGAVVGLALATVTISLLDPGLLILLPLSLLLLALPPRRPAFLLLGVALAGFVFLGASNDPFWYVERGWVLMLGAWFVVMVAAFPGKRFLPLGLGALGASLSSAAAFLFVRRDGWPLVDWTIGRRVRDAAAEVATIWANAGTGEWAGELARGIYQVADVQAMLHPALISIASLAGLGVAWWVYRRFVARDPAPFGPFREFRFRDDLIWLVIAGILLVVLPLGGAAVRIGSNVIAFMGALYALRGIAVLMTLLGVQGIGGVLLLGIAILFLPVALAATVLIGLTDTWFDLRARRAAARPSS